MGEAKTRSRRRRERAGGGNNTTKLVRPLFEQVEQAEATAASSVRVNEDKQERAEQTGVGERSNRAKHLQGEYILEQSIQDTIIFMHGLSKLKSPLLTPPDVTLQQWPEDCRARRSFVSELKEQRSMVLGLKHALSGGVRLCNEGTGAHDG